jgi:hypothetical protein
MSYTIEEIRDLKPRVSEKLRESLSQKFNRAGLSVASGIRLGKNDTADFTFRIYDRSRPDELVEEEILEFARDEVKKLAPGSDPEVMAITLYRPSAP